MSNIYRQFKRPDIMMKATPRPRSRNALLLFAVAATIVLVGLSRGSIINGMFGGMPSSAYGTTASSSIRTAVRPFPMQDADATPVLPTPLMTYLELLTLQTYVRGVRLYIEWGSGASTSLVAPLAKTAVSIDNNLEWCQKVAARSDTQWWQVNNVLKLVCVDTGKI